MNGLKNILGATINAVAIVAFILAKTVVWPIALLMVVGSVVGGYAGSRLARKVPRTAIRALVVCIGTALTVYFFVHG